MKNIRFYHFFITIAMNTQTKLYWRLTMYVLIQWSYLSLFNMQLLVKQKAVNNMCLFNHNQKQNTEEVKRKICYRFCLEILWEFKLRIFPRKSRLCIYKSIFDLFDLPNNFLFNLVTLNDKHFLSRGLKIYLLTVNSNMHSLYFVENNASEYSSGINHSFSVQYWLRYLTRTVLLFMIV
jgi:hypothetical protein